MMTQQDTEKIRERSTSPQNQGTRYHLVALYLEERGGLFDFLPLKEKDVSQLLAPSLEVISHIKDSGRLRHRLGSLNTINATVTGVRYQLARSKDYIELSFEEFNKRGRPMEMYQ